MYALIFLFLSREGENVILGKGKMLFLIFKLKSSCNSLKFIMITSIKGDLYMR